MMIRRFIGNLYFLTFLNGFLLASLFYFKMEADYEKELFQAIHADIKSKINSNESQDSVAVKIMHACHGLLVNRGSVFVGKDFDGFKSNLLEPTSFDLMTARGACGSFSLVLASILQGYNYEVRIAQMKSGDRDAAHNLVEAKTHHGWIVLDPLFDLYFKTPSQKLASFDDVKNNWSFYKTQLPPGYDMKYRYDQVRYTNWTKIPVILPAIKTILDFSLGKKEADNISLRTYFLRKYNVCFGFSLVIFIFIFTLTMIKLLRTKVFPKKNIPMTFSNFLKYLRPRIFEKGLRKQSQA